LDLQKSSDAYDPNGNRHELEKKGRPQRRFSASFARAEEKGEKKKRGKRERAWLFTCSGNERAAHTPSFIRCGKRWTREMRWKKGGEKNRVQASCRIKAANFSPCLSANKKTGERRKKRERKACSVHALRRGIRPSLAWLPYYDLRRRGKNEKNGR